VDGLVQTQAVRLSLVKDTEAPRPAERTAIRLALVPAAFVPPATDLSWQRQAAFLKTRRGDIIQTMHRVRVESTGDGNTILLRLASQVHHLRDVLRLTVGESVTVFDDVGSECLCTVEHIGRESVGLTVRARNSHVVRGARLTVAVAVPKKGMDEIIDKLTQLGVESIIPMRTERVVVRLSGEGAVGKADRWRRLAQAAAEQSQSSRVPEVRPVTDFETVLAVPADLRLIPHLCGDRKTLTEALGRQTSGSILVLIGPEGDFTDAEVRLALQYGFVPVSLGPQVLRVDTAAIAVAGYLRVAGII
jgi:16S rRNA (uracil1498-N3)-methyltransferase